MEGMAKMLPGFYTDDFQINREEYFMKLFTKSMASDASLGVAERCAYMGGNIGTALINTIIATFLMFYYTDVMMLNTGVIGTILLFSRVFDGVTDLVMGMIVDRTKSKHGRARVWLLRMCVPFAISGFLLVCVPGGSAEIVKYVYVFLTYNLCNTVCLTALYVPYNAMTVNITENPYERGLLGVFVMLGAVIGTMVVQSTVTTATTALGGDQRAWQIVIGIYAVCGLLLHLLCFVGTKERCGSSDDNKKIDFKMEMKALFTNRYWLISVGSIFLIMFFTNFTGSAGVYFAKGVLGDQNLYANLANAMSVSQLITLFLAAIPMKKIGKRNTAVLGLVIILAGMGIQIVAGTNLTFLTAASVMKGLGAGFTGAVGYGLVADTIDYGEWLTGTKAEGVGMAALTFVTKVSAGLTGVVIGWAMQIGHYDPMLTVQKESTIHALQICFTWIPAIMIILGMILLFFYDLDKKYEQIQADLKARR